MLGFKVKVTIGLLLELFADIVDARTKDEEPVMLVPSYLPPAENDEEAVKEKRIKWETIRLEKIETSELKKYIPTYNEKINPKTFEKIREKYPRAYVKWNNDEDQLLETKYREGVSIPELARIFRRKKGAITFRLKKLGLIDN